MDNRKSWLFSLFFKCRALAWPRGDSWGSDSNIWHRPSAKGTPMVRAKGRLVREARGAVVPPWQLPLSHRRAFVQGCEQGMSAANSGPRPPAELTNWCSAAAAPSQLLPPSKCSGQKYRASRFLFGCYLSGHYLHFLIRNSC